MTPPKHPDWSGRTAAVICNGPSLTKPQVDLARLLRPSFIVAVNTAYLMAPKAEIFYAGDMLFWRTHHARMRQAAAHYTQFWTADSSSAERYNLNLWRGVNRPGLGTERVHFNGNSGAQAINLAYLFGAHKILLLGMTMREIDGKRHFHGNHEAPLTQTQLFPEWLKKMEVVARDAERLGVDIVNCDPLSAMQCFRFGGLEEELK